VNRVLVRKSFKKSSLGRLMRRWEHNTKMIDVTGVVRMEVASNWLRIVSDGWPWYWC
jgi:hypothetical protein